jgi:hypothetical protein
MKPGKITTPQGLLTKLALMNKEKKKQKKKGLSRG